ncbi:MAG: hypothetical protein KKC68_06800 [Candidatus Thermoplasmatota archaeon]|nr:hypothetical protein [Candidatus Thermoplasmatota archaeon]
MKKKVVMMNNIKTIGLVLFLGGIILFFIYGIYLGFEEIIQTLDYITGFLLGIILIGFIVLLLCIVIEQRKNTKETMKDIKKEDLEP